MGKRPVLASVAPFPPASVCNFDGFAWLWCVQGMPRDGYDYFQHVRTILPGSTFLTAKGEVTSSTAVAILPSDAPPVIPAEALPSERMVDRMLDAIVIDECEWGRPRRGVRLCMCVCVSLC